MKSINQTSPTQVISAFLQRYLQKIRPVKPINQSLLRQAHALLNDPHVSEVLSAQCERELGGQNSKVSTAIHPADQMLTHSIRVLEDVNQSISQYFCVACNSIVRSNACCDWPSPTASKTS